MSRIEGLEARVLFTTDVAIGYISKEESLVQTGPSTVVPATPSNSNTSPFDFGSGVQLNTGGALTSASLTLPNSTVLPMTFSESDGWSINGTNFNDQADMDAAYPAGNYTLSVDGVDDGNQAFNLAVPSDQFTATPEFTTGTFSAIQTADGTQNLTVNWNTFTGGTTNDYIQLRVRDNNGNSVYSTPGPKTTGAMVGTATSFTIPAGTMTNGNGYSLELTFYKIPVQDTTDYPGALGAVSFTMDTFVTLYTAGAPVAATGVNASQGAYPHHVQIQWNSVDDANGYQIFRSTTSDFSTATKIAAGITGTVYNDNTALPGVSYFYWVRGRNASAVGAPGGPSVGFVPLPPPFGFAASNGTFPHHVQLTWAAVSGASGYQIFRSTTDDVTTATKVGTGITTTFFNDNTAVNGQEYFYWVRARDAAGVGLFSIAEMGSLG